MLRFYYTDFSVKSLRQGFNWTIIAQFSEKETSLKTVVFQLFEV